MRHLSNSNPTDPGDARLDGLFAAYRDAIQDPEPSADFMPRVWRGIEARRSIPSSLRQIAQSFITAAAAICLFLSFVLLRPSTPTPVFTTASYVDVLASSASQERMAYAEITPDDVDGEDFQQ